MTDNYTFHHLGQLILMYVIVSLTFEGFLLSDYILSKTAGKATCLQRVELQRNTTLFSDGQAKLLHWVFICLPNGHEVWKPFPVWLSYA